MQHYVPTSPGAASSMQHAAHPQLQGTPHQQQDTPTRSEAVQSSPALSGLATGAHSGPQSAASTPGSQRLEEEAAAGSLQLQARMHAIAQDLQGARAALFGTPAPFAARVDACVRTRTPAYTTLAADAQATADALKRQQATAGHVAGLMHELIM